MTTNKPDPWKDEGDSDTSSKGDELSEKDDIKADIRCVFALIDSGLNENETKFDPKAEKEKYCDECDKALNDNKIVGCVVAKLTYEDDDYKYIDHTDPIFDGCYDIWCCHYGNMAHEKMELECDFFTGSRFSGNNLGLILVSKDYTQRWHGKWQEYQHQMYQVT